ncbi:uncharacterized protein MONOS_13140 [Monocercomonoides exilis]|uniref:uncharacterized protein n=1 Tax=Monocercomonoides exilis TaxID=2049356 RepID=UPI00355A64E0|nr:hypothetical protein MONOS_13140 [Monocercomonoides exilis]|eukprot:MONOS_13140.1-p1 / transcript=MONOS_13140.1 / gene=MONOS_13140 / organism=Monocercomonoides_exilis_PA203 / gene_product=unspecified product / transcript_product=unspecified product / location=Mono_scaffold00782:13017-14423(+) / protein_length=429 / sequence_SO=supercontig / SO=protein_coding / is_pseudo=false
MQAKNATERFTELFSKLEHSTESEQKHEIEELHGLMEEMDREEFESAFTEELFNSIDKMIEEKKMPLENAVLLLNHLGYNRTLKFPWNYGFDDSSLSERFEKMIIEEEMKEEGMNEKLLFDLCKCYQALSFNLSAKLLPICASCLLKVAFNKEKNEETRKEVEIAFLALSNIHEFIEIEQKLYLNEIKEIIEYHKEHHNLTQLTYQSAWDFLIKRFIKDRNLEEVIANKLHFAREAAREIEELAKTVDWKRKEGNKREREREEEYILLRWIRTLRPYFCICKLWNDESVELVSSVVNIFRAVNDNSSEICDQCICVFVAATENEAVKSEELLKGGAVEAVLEAFVQFEVKSRSAKDYLLYFKRICERLKEKTDDEANEAKRFELKRKIFEKMEEEGYEDFIIGLNHYIEYGTCYYVLVQNVENYFVYF